MVKINAFIGPFTYRPNRSDDWGLIRDANGDVAAVVQYPPGLTEDEIQECRNFGIDPRAPFGDAVTKMLNVVSGNEDFNKRPSQGSDE